MVLFCAEMPHTQEQVSTMTCLPPCELPWESSLWETSFWEAMCLCYSDRGESLLQLTWTSNWELYPLWPGYSSLFRVSVAWETAFVCLLHRNPTQPPWSCMDFYSKTFSSVAFINKVVVLQKSVCQPSINHLNHQFLERGRYSYLPTIYPKETISPHEILRHKCNSTHVTQKKWV